jgi:hypothetical protein
MLHTLHLKRRPPSTHVQNGFMYVRQRLQRTMPWLPSGITGTLRPMASSAIGRTIMPRGSCHLQSSNAGTASVNASNGISTASSSGRAGQLVRSSHAVTLGRQLQPGHAAACESTHTTDENVCWAASRWNARIHAAHLRRSAVLLGTPMTVGRMLSALQLARSKGGCGERAPGRSWPMGRGSVPLSASGAPGPADSTSDSNCSTSRYIRLKTDTHNTNC